MTRVFPRWLYSGEQFSTTMYDVSSDFWSFGISMIEVATGKFYYSSWGDFSQFIPLCEQKMP